VAKINCGVAAWLVVRLVFTPSIFSRAERGDFRLFCQIVLRFFCQTLVGATTPSVATRSLCWQRAYFSRPGSDRQSSSA
jgi:hypothetical protein